MTLFVHFFCSLYEKIVSNKYINGATFSVAYIE